MRLDSGEDLRCKRAAWLCPCTEPWKQVTDVCPPVLRGQMLTLCRLPGAKGPTLHFSGGGARPKERGPRIGPRSPRRKWMKDVAGSLDAVAGGQAPPRGCADRVAPWGRCSRRAASVLAEPRAC